MGESKIRFGICGLGFMGRTHFAHLREHAQAGVVAVCDRDAQRRSGDWSDGVGNIGARDAERVSLEGIRAYPEVEELLQDDHVDAVAITLPTAVHAELTVAALRAGKHVFCEKPMALTLADCDRMIAAAEDSRRMLMIGQCVRFWPQYETIKRMVAQGAIGAVRFATLRRLSCPPGYSSSNWLMDAKQSGGALLDLHVHDIDFAHDLLGVPETIQARGSAGPSGGIDHVAATYSYRDGRYALLEGGWVFGAPWAFEMAITVQGEEGTLHWSSLGDSDVLHYRGGDEAGRTPCEAGTGWTRELDYFVACIRASRSVERCLPRSSRTSIALALLEKRSIEEGGPVAVSVGS